jgi:hypothetical protein
MDKKDKSTGMKDSLKKTMLKKMRVRVKREQKI